MAVRGVKSARHMAAVQDGRIPPQRHPACRVPAMQEPTPFYCHLDLHTCTEQGNSGSYLTTPTIVNFFKRAKRAVKYRCRPFHFGAVVRPTSGRVPSTEMTVYDAASETQHGDFNSFNFWKAPIDAGRILSEATNDFCADDIAPPTFALNEPTANGAPPQQHMVTQDQIRKLDKMLKPMLKPIGSL